MNLFKEMKFEPLVVYVVQAHFKQIIRTCNCLCLIVSELAHYVPLFCCHAFDIGRLFCLHEDRVPHCCEVFIDIDVATSILPLQVEARGIEAVPLPLQVEARGIEAVPLPPQGKPDYGLSNLPLHLPSQSMASGYIASFNFNTCLVSH